MKYLLTIAAMLLAALTVQAADCGCAGRCASTACACTPAATAATAQAAAPGRSFHYERRRIGLFRWTSVLVEDSPTWPQPMPGPPTTGVVLPADPQPTAPAANGCPGGQCPNPRSVLPRRR